MDTGPDVYADFRRSPPERSRGAGCSRDEERLTIEAPCTRTCDLARIDFSPPHFSVLPLSPPKAQVSRPASKARRETLLALTVTYP